MNFSYRNTIAKQKELVSVHRKIFSKTAVTVIKVVLFILLLVAVTVISATAGIVKGIMDNSPDVNEISIVPSSYSTTVYDKDKKEIAKLVTTGSNRIKVSLSQVPEHMQWAFIDTEDVRFYEHNGIDMQGIVRAGVVALQTGDASEGASTLTQQVLKNNVFTTWTSETTIIESLRRKLQEQYLAVQLEKTTSKSTILETYLNTINLGANTLGVQAASYRYFNKDVSKLTLSESTVIAAITQAPTTLNPIAHPKKNGARRKKILKNMLEQGHITKEEMDEALADDVYSRIKQVNNQITESDSAVYTYFVDEVIKQVMDDLQEQKGYSYNQAYNLVYGGGLKIYSTQDQQIQRICNEEVSNSENYPYDITYSINWNWSVQNPDGSVDNFDENDIATYHRGTLKEQDFKLIFNNEDDAKGCVNNYKEHLMEKYYPHGVDEELGYTQSESLFFIPQPQASFTVMEQNTGYIKAIVGGRGKKNVSLSLDRATSSTRQPGSCFKILAAYAPAMETKGYTTKTTIVDEPFNYANGIPVHNWNNRYVGTVTVEKAIANSMNVCAVKTITDVTPQVAFEYLQNFGFTTLVSSREEADGSVTTDIGQALALGGITDGITNLEITAAYATIANKGTYIKPAFYTQVIDSNGRILLNNTRPASHNVISKESAKELMKGMAAVINYGTATDCRLDKMPSVGKTGTTTSEYDLWFCGITPYFTASIWSGYDENKSLSGDQSFHKRIWTKILNRIDEVKKLENIPFEFEDGDTIDNGKTSSKGRYYDWDDDDDEDYSSSGNNDNDDDSKVEDQKKEEEKKPEDAEKKEDEGSDNSDDSEKSDDGGSDDSGDEE